MNVNSAKPNGEIIGSEGSQTIPCNPQNGQMMGDSLAMVYSPKQYWADLFSEDEALLHGTLFKDLYKPIEVIGEGRAK